MSTRTNPAAGACDGTPGHGARNCASPENEIGNAPSAPPGPAGCAGRPGDGLAWRERGQEGFRHPLRPPLPAFPGVTHAIRRRRRGQNQVPATEGEQRRSLVRIPCGHFCAVVALVRRGPLRHRSGGTQECAGENPNACAPMATPRFQLASLCQHFDALDIKSNETGATRAAASWCSRIDRSSNRVGARPRARTRMSMRAPDKRGDHGCGPVRQGDPAGPALDDSGIPG